MASRPDVPLSSHGLSLIVAYASTHLFSKRIIKFAPFRTQKDTICLRPKRSVSSGRDNLSQPNSLFNFPPAIMIKQAVPLGQTRVARNVRPDAERLYVPALEARTELQIDTACIDIDDWVIEVGGG